LSVRDTPGYLAVRVVTHRPLPLHYLYSTGNPAAGGPSSTPKCWRNAAW
jgi:hypothetical protein